MTSSMDKVSGESRIKLQHLEGDTNTHLTMLDSKTRQMIEDLKNTVTTLAATSESERERMEQRIISLIEKSSGAQNMQIVSYLCCILLRVLSLSSKLVAALFSC